MPPTHSWGALKLGMVVPVSVCGSGGQSKNYAVEDWLIATIVDETKRRVEARATRASVSRAARARRARRGTDGGARLPGATNARARRPASLTLLSPLSSFSRTESASGWRAATSGWAAAPGRATRGAAAYQQTPPAQG